MIASPPLFCTAINQAMDIVRYFFLVNGFTPLSSTVRFDLVR